MSALAQQIRRSYREIQLYWVRLADRAFTSSAPVAHDDRARGEFISAFIYEPESPSAARPDRSPR